VRFTVQDDRGGRLRWWLWDSGGRLVAVSGAPFASAASARRAALNFKAGARGWTYDVYTDRGGSQRWRAKSANGAHVASSGPPFPSASAARRAIATLRDQARHATGP
jgi:uncharacterized protein YegP (UPF0339 family)